jgi:hypothetical protein
VATKPDRTRQARWFIPVKTPLLDWHRHPIALTAEEIDVAEPAATTTHVCHKTRLDLDAPGHVRFDETPEDLRTLELCVSVSQLRFQPPMAP